MREHAPPGDCEEQAPLQDHGRPTGNREVDQPKREPGDRCAGDVGRDGGSEDGDMHNVKPSKPALDRLKLGEVREPFPLSVRVRHGLYRSLLTGGERTLPLQS